jgi:hypothetical protein
MEEIRFSEVSVNVYQATLRHIADGSPVYSCHSKNFKCALKHHRNGQYHIYLFMWRMGWLFNDAISIETIYSVNEWLMYMEQLLE